MAATATLDTTAKPVDTQNHQIVVNSDGQKTGVLIPYAEYQLMMRQLRHTIEYLKMEESLHRALDEVKLIRENKLSAVTLEELLDEL